MSIKIDWNEEQGAWLDQHGQQYEYHRLSEVVFVRDDLVYKLRLNSKKNYYIAKYVPYKKRPDLYLGLENERLTARLDSMEAAYTREIDALRKQLSSVKSGYYDSLAIRPAVLESNMSQMAQAAQASQAPVDALPAYKFTGWIQQFNGKGWKRYKKDTYVVQDCESTTDAIARYCQHLENCYGFSEVSYTLETDKIVISATWCDESMRVTCRLEQII